MNLVVIEGNAIARYIDGVQDCVFNEVEWSAIPNVSKLIEDIRVIGADAVFLDVEQETK